MIKVGNKIVQHAKLGNKNIYEVSLGPNLKLVDTSSLNTLSKDLVDISEWKPEGENTTAGVHTTNNTFCFNSTDKTVSTISSSTYTDTELNTWATATDAENSGTTMLVVYTFGCAKYGKITLPNWIQDILKNNSKTVTCTFSANIWAKVETGKVNRWTGKPGGKPGKTDAWLLLRQNNTAADDPNTISNIVSSGLVTIDKSITGSGTTKAENSGVASLTTTLKSDTKDITWACLFDPERLTVGSSYTCDYSLHTATFNNIKLTLTIN